MGMCHQSWGTVKACRAKISTWPTKYLKLPICREFERENLSQFFLSDNSSWQWKRKSVLFKLINTAQLGPNLLFGYYRLRDRTESWHVLKKLWLSRAAKLAIDSTRLWWKLKKANGNHSSLPPTLFFTRILLQIDLHYFLSVSTISSLPNNLCFPPTAPATWLYSKWTC